MLRPVSPLKHLSLSPPTCQGGAEGPVPVPGQAVPCVPGRGRPGGHLPAGPAEEQRGEEDVCQQLGRGEEEGPVLPDQASDGEWGPCPRGVVASLPASRVAYPPTSSLSSPASLKGWATPTFPQGRDRGSGKQGNLVESDPSQSEAKASAPWFNLSRFRKFAGTAVALLTKVTNVTARPAPPAFLTSQACMFTSRLSIGEAAGSSTGCKDVTWTP